MKTLTNAVIEERQKLAKIAVDPCLAIPYFMKSTETGTHIRLGELHKEWHRVINNNRFCLINSPRDHGKSEQIAVGRVLYELAMNPNIRIKLFSGKGELATKRSKAIKKYIESDKDYRNLYMNVRPEDLRRSWGDSSFTIKRKIVSKEPSVEACGIMSAVTGDRADLIICDDIVTQDNALTEPAMRPKVKEKFYNDVMNLLEPKTGRLIYIATRWHQDDLTTDLMENTHKNKFFVYKKVIEEDMKPIWHEKWDSEALWERRNQIKEVAFKRGYMDQPYDDTMTLFPKDVISRCIHRGEPSDVVKPEWRRYMGVDLAISKNDVADYTVVFVIAVNEDFSVRYPLDIVRDKLSSPETADVIIQKNKQWKPEIIYVENNAYQDSTRQWIERDVLAGRTEPLPIEPFNTGKQKSDEYIGLPSIVSEFHNNMWDIRMHRNPIEDKDNHCECVFCKWVEEMMMFPQGAHKDTVMAAWFAREAARKDNMGGVVDVKW